MRALAACLLLAVLALPARAETLIIGLSTQEFGITSSFTGGEIIIFGTVQRDARTVARRGNYHIAIVVKGPRDNIVTRKKARIAGIWVNNRAEVFPGAPTYYATLSSSPLGEISSPAILERNGIGTSFLQLQPQDSDEAFSDKNFRDAMVRLKKEQGLYYDLPGAVEFLAPSLFSASIPLPENVVVGPYTGTAYLFGDGVMLGSEKFEFVVRKEGFEQLMYELAHDYSLLYGIAAVLIAIFTGWAAGVIFRKD